MEYSHKASGVMKMFGLESLVWNINEPNENLQKLCSDIWEQKDDLSQTLKRMMPDIKKQTYALVNEIERFFP